MIHFCLRLILPLLTLTALAALPTLHALELTPGMSVDPLIATAKPSKGVHFLDPAYGTTIVRVTDHAHEPPSGFARNDYARRQAFNADNSLQLIYAYDGAWHLYRTDTNAYVSVLPFLAGDAEPQWHPTNPDLLYYLPTSGIGMTIRLLNVRTGTSQVVADLSARLRARWPTANAAWTRSEGSPSADGRYWCLMVDSGAWTSLGIITYDLTNNQILGYYNTGSDHRPDHVSMSPSGTYGVVSWSEAPGTVAFTRDFSQQKILHHTSDHSDLALDVNGDDIYVSIDYGANAGDVFMVNLRTGVHTDLFPTYLDHTATALHISGKAFAHPGWVLVSTYADGGGDRQWLHRKLFALELKANPTIYQLAHHHVISHGYWSEPHASVNRDFTKIAFDSNWDVDSELDVDTYRIELPAGVIVHPGTLPSNQAPTAHAGSDRSLTLPSAASLSGTATDDGLPSGSSLTYAWSKISGPGNVTFSAVNLAATSASFSVAGTYVVRLTVSDGSLHGSDDLTITVNPPITTTPPLAANAGVDRTLSLPATLTLSGTATPLSSTLTYAWTKITGPGLVQFTSPGSAQTSVSFATAGTYVLRLAVQKGTESANDELTVTVTGIGIGTPPPVVAHDDTHGGGCGFGGGGLAVLGLGLAGLRRCRRSSLSK